MVSCVSIFLDDASDTNHDGMLEDVSGGNAQGFVRRIDKVMLLIACVLITNVSDSSEGR